MAELTATPREHARLGTEPIDGLRGFAVLLVVCYHTWLFSWLDPSFVVAGRTVGFYWFVRPGYLGVDIFFLISAFCLTYPYVRAYATGRPVPSLREFALRRFIKIVPSYLFVLVATLAVAKSNHSVSPADWNKVVWEHAFFVQNVEYDRLGYDNSVLWSLAVEVQFYLLFPVLIWCFLRAPIWTALAMIAVAQAHRHIEANCCLHDETVMRLLPAFFDLFGIGMLAAYAVVRLPEIAPALARQRWLFTTLAVASLAGVLAMLAWLDDRTYAKDVREWFAVSMRSVFGAALGLFAAASCLGLRWWRGLVGNPVLTWLSLVSYNLYLWHTLIELFLAHHHIPGSSTRVPHDDPHWPLSFVAVSFAAIAVVVTAITYFVERPLLALIKPQSFAFRYGSLFARARGPRAVAISSESRGPS